MDEQIGCWFIASLITSHWSIRLLVKYKAMECGTTFSAVGIRHSHYFIVFLISFTSLFINLNAIVYYGDTVRKIRNQNTIRSVLKQKKSNNVKKN